MSIIVCHQSEILKQYTAEYKTLSQYPRVSLTGRKVLKDHRRSAATVHVVNYETQIYSSVKKWQLTSAMNSGKRPGLSLTGDLSNNIKHKLMEDHE